MSFRPATMRDAACIYVWRRLDESRAWYVADPTEYEQHLAWLEARIHNPLVKLLVWERDGVAAGMVRVDSNGEVAFHGDDPHMLLAATNLGGGRLKATLDLADPKVPLLLQAGFVPYDATALVYKPKEERYEPCPAACAATRRTLDPGYMPENAQSVAPPPCPVCHNAGRVLVVVDEGEHMSGGTITPFDWELDFSQYAIVDRVGLSVDHVPTSFLFAYDEYHANGGTSGIFSYWREWNQGTTDGE